MVSGSTPTQQVETVLARVLTGAPVIAATDAKGQYITRESARTLAELVATDVVDAIQLTEAAVYRVVIEQLSQHKWSHTAVLQGQFCHCGYNGDHENHLTLCIVRAIEKLASDG